MTDTATSEDITPRVIAIITAIRPQASSQLAQPDTVDLITDLGFDSINVLDLIVEIEKTFAVDLRIERIVMDDLRTIPMICELILRHKGP
jgi:acyl carrier protein